MIQGTYGRTYFDSSASAGLPSLWANKLAERLATLGSTESALIWKVKALPSGRLKPRLVPSTRHTNDCGTGGLLWPTPTVADIEGGRKTRSGARSDEMLLNGLLSGAAPNGSDAPTEKRGAPQGVPNPNFAMWLMGFPEDLRNTILDVCSSLPSKGAQPHGASPETQLSQNSPLKSSSRSKKHSPKPPDDLFG